MPLNVRGFCFSLILVLAISTFIKAQVQNAEQPAPLPTAAAPIKPPTAAEVMRERISKSKALIAVRNYNAAIYELEMVRRETSDASVHAVANILLMNSYLEQGNYKKAQDFLNAFYRDFKANNANGSTNYAAVAAQIVKGARSQVDRYRGLGLTVSDRNLPLQALNDIEGMRETLELVIAQTKEAGSDKAKASVATPLLEEALVARSSLGRDDYDAKRWRDEAGEAREDLASSRSIVISALGVSEPPETSQAAVSPVPASLDTSANAVVKPVVEPSPAGITSTNAANGPSDTHLASTELKPVMKPAVKQPETSEDDRPARTPMVQKIVSSEPVNKPAEGGSEGALQVGSLLPYATRQSSPVYPQAARAVRASGVVRVEVVVDEQGNVAEVQKANGHALLQAAARDAIVKWKFKPFLRDGQPVRAAGFVNFNFSL